MYTHMLIRLSHVVLPYQPGKRKGLAEIKGNVWPRFMGEKMKFEIYGKVWPVV